MKNLLLVLLSIFFLSPSKGQNQLFVHVQTSANAVFKLGNQFRGLTGYHYLSDNILLEKKMYPSFSAGITYETPSFHLFDSELFVRTDLTMTYKNLGNTFYQALLLSNDFFLPVSKNEKRFKIHFGIRNTLLLSDFVSEDNRNFFPIRKYFYGAVVLMNYKVTPRLQLGFNFCTELKDFVISATSLAYYRTVESGFQLSYRL